jgi:hypothetical protein
MATAQRHLFRRAAGDRRCVDIHAHSDIASLTAIAAYFCRRNIMRLSATEQPSPLA